MRKKLIRLTAVLMCLVFAFGWMNSAQAAVTKPSTFYSGDLTGATWYWPVNASSKSQMLGQISSAYGYRTWPDTFDNHVGLDIGNGVSVGAEVRPVREGRVTYVQPNNSGARGKYIIINHEDGYWSLYQHLNETRVTKGQWVTLSQVIGTVGKTGQVTGAHLHLEIFYSSNLSVNWTGSSPSAANVNPTPPEKENYLGSDGKWVRWGNGTINYQLTRPSGGSSPATYTVSFNDNGSVETVTKAAGSTIGSLPLIIRNGYSFDGWYTAASGGTKISSSTVVTGNVTYYAHWTANTYTVSYNANGGSSNSSVNKTHGSTLGTLPTPSRTGYSFDGWYTAASGGSKVSASTTVTGNVTYYAHWTANTYTVSYNANGGSSNSSVNKTHGSTLGTLPTPSRTGYSFDGWYTAVSGGSKVSTSTTVTGNVTYYAHWTANIYTVSYNANGGSPNSSVSRTYGSILGTLPTPSRSGYSFDGWYTAASGGSKISAGTTVTGNVTYYAAWNRQNPGTLALDYVMAGSGKEIKVPIRLDQNPGIMIVTMTIGYDKTKLSFEGVEDGKFKEWIVNKEKGTISWFGPSDKYSNGTIVTLVFETTNNFNGIADITLEKVEAANQREESVVFSKSDGKVIFNESLSYYIGYHPNKGTGAPESQSFTNHELVREVAISINEDLLARASLDANIASGDESSIQGALANWELQRQAVLEETKNLELVNETGKNFKLSQTKPTRSGYTFQGWATSADGSVVYQPGDTYKEAKDIVLYAVWSPITYTIKYNANGGSGAPAAQTKNHDETLTLSSAKPTLAGYTFQGWATTKDGSVEYQSGASYTANKAVTLYAVWKVNTYKVKFDANGGTDAPAAQTKTHDKNLTLSGDKPTRTGYTFQGWATTKDGSVEYQPGGSYTANKAVTLYAVWKINTYTVKFDANGGSGAPAAQTKTYGKALTLSSTKPTRSGYTFQGWATSKDGSVAYQPGGSYTANKAVTLYAVWEKNAENTMTLEIGNASGVKGSKIVLPIKLSKNTGVSSMRLVAEFDSSKLKLTGVKDGDMKGWTFNSDKNILIWYNEKDYTGNGTVVSLEFEIIMNFTGDTSIGLKEATAADDTKEYNLTVNKGTISYSSRLPGDVNDDKKVSLVDLVRLCKYLAGYDVEIHALNSDVTADGKISLVDLVRLCKYLAGYDVVLE